MDTLRGSLLMVLAMAAFALEDMFIKSAAQSLPVGQILILFGAGGMVIFALMARAQGEPLWNPVFCTRALLLRSVAEVAGRLCFTLAIALTPLSSASAILQATHWSYQQGLWCFSRNMWACAVGSRSQQGLSVC